MSNDSSGNSENIMILACSGGSNVGQLSNQTAIDLAREGVGKMSCLAGLGGKIDKFIKAAANADKIIVIDGCDVGCGKAIMENNGIENKHYVLITDLGIEKNKNFDLVAKELEKVKAKTKHIIAS